MKTIKINLSRDIKKLEIVPLGDVHLGSPNCKINEVLERIEYIKNNPNAYCILAGDLIDNAIKSSVSDVYGETMTPMEQLLKIRDMLYPIKDKIVCLVQGNHEFRTKRNDSVDLCMILARELGIVDRYAPASAVIFLKFGLKDRQHGRTEQQSLYTIFVNHGTGASGKKMGGNANHLSDMSNIVDADIFLTAHSHKLLAFKQNFYRTNLTQGNLVELERLYVNINSFLGYDNDYGEFFGLTPSSRSNPTIILSGTKREMKVLM